MQISDLLLLCSKVSNKSQYMFILARYKLLHLEGKNLRRIPSHLQFEAFPGNTENAHFRLALRLLVKNLETSRFTTSVAHNTIGFFTLVVKQMIQFIKASIVTAADHIA